MSYMFEVYYKAPVDKKREAAIGTAVAAFGGHLDYREEPKGQRNRVCLTYEFTALKRAESAAAELKRLGEHVEGPNSYGDDLLRPAMPRPRSVAKSNQPNLQQQ